jgi:UDP-GlcNAc3NAcA epimerase
VGSASHGRQTADMLARLEEVFVEQQPRAVLIYGDTNSTLAAALAAVKLHIPVAHVEAGLRSFNRRMPEEINRIMADSVSDVFFAPTEAAVTQLRSEGQPAERIVWTGDVMYDVALLSADIARQRSTVLQRIGLSGSDYYLATIHRAENTDDGTRLRAICTALEEVAARYRVVLPLHPRTRAALTREGLLQRAEQAFTLIEPVGYLDMVQLEMSASAIVTDSGGVQKEAFFHAIPCFTLREETEWVELVQLGWNTLVPPADPRQMAARLLELHVTGRTEAKPYGNGDAARIIVDELLRRYG